VSLYKIYVNSFRPHTSSNEDRFSSAAYLVLNGAEVSGLEQLEEHLVVLQVKTSNINYKNGMHVYQNEKNQKKYQIMNMPTKKQTECV
jgi:pantothenate kinase